MSRDPLITKGLEELDKVRARVEAFDAPLADLREVLAGLGWDAQPHFNSLKDATYELVCSVFVKDMKQVAGLLGQLAKRGYRQSISPLDVSVGGFRSYCCGPIKLWVHFRGGACRYVKTGTRTEDVMELRCDNVPVTEAV